MKTMFLTFFLMATLCGEAGGKTSLPEQSQKLRSAAAEIRLQIHANSATDIRALFKKLATDSTHFYFNADELNDCASTLKKEQALTAIKILNETRLVFPKSVETVVLLGEVYEETGNRYMARQVYEEALAMKPDPTITYILLKRVSLLVAID